jgi:hypothetical protein
MLLYQNHFTDKIFCSLFVRPGVSSRMEGIRMEILLLFIFAVLFAMGFNYGMPRLQTRFAANSRVGKYATSYGGQTAVTAVMVFTLLVAVAFVFSLAGQSARVGGVSVS